MALFRKGNGKPKKASQWASVIALVFGIGTIGIIIANYVVPDFPINAKTFIFLIVVAIALFIGLKILRFATPDKQLALEDFIIYGAVLAGIILFLITFNIAPEFQIVAKQIASIVGI